MNTASRDAVNYGYGWIGNTEVLVDPNTNDVFESGSNNSVGRKLGTVRADRFYATGTAMGDPAVRQLDAAVISYEKPIVPVTPAAAKPKFNKARATTFEGEGGYKYAIDPETNVIAILESPKRPSGGPVYVRPDGKFQDAHKAILAEYRAGMVTPKPVVAEKQPAPSASPVQAAELSVSDSAQRKRPLRTLLGRVYDSSASDISSDDF